MNVNIPRMKVVKSGLWLLLITMWLTAPLCAQEFASTPENVELSDGDTLVFLGDSITHQCLYTQYVEDYFYTRYPDRRIHFHNAGVSGDQAIDTLVRFQEDVAQLKPKYVTILIGMNDGHYEPLKQETFNTYKRNMTYLLAEINAIGALAIPMAPTMYDLRAAIQGGGWIDQDQLKNMHYNATLAFFGAWCREQAETRGLGFVNMYERLNQLTRKQRKTDPTFTLIEDAVHPGEAGQLIMAYALLQDIGADPLVSSIHVDRKNGRWIVRAENGSITDASRDSVSFTFTADSLPWVVPEDARLGYGLCGAGSTLSRETLQVTGLDPGTHTLEIDGKAVGDYTHTELAAGIELQENAKTPQYAQALEVAMLNKQRNDEAISPIRDLWLEMKIRRHGEEEWAKEEDLDLGGQDFQKWQPEFRRDVAALKEKARKLEAQIYKINQPRPHEYEIR